MIHGILPALPTPFQGPSWELDRPALERIITFLREHRVHGFVVCGTWGEGPSLTHREKVAVLETALEAGGGLPVILGIVTSSLIAAQELSREAQRLGAAGLLVMPPTFYPAPDEEGLLRFLRTLLDATELPVLLAHQPQDAGVGLSDGLLGELTGHPNLLGIQDAEGARHRFLEFGRRFPDLALFGGADELIDFALANGARGCITPMAVLCPDLMVSMANARREERQDAAALAQVDRLRQVLARYASPQDIKAGLPLLDLPESAVRPPLVELGEKEREALHQELSRIGFVPTSSG